MVQTIDPTERGDAGPAVAAVARFLERYGYLGPAPTDGPSTLSRRFDDSIEEAIASYQHLHGLAETGRLDAKTLRFMNTPRCGVADVRGRSTLRALVGPGHGWAKRNITFSIDLDNDLPSLGAIVVRNEVVIALDLWSAAGGLVFTEAFHADIFVAFRRGEHGDGHPSLAFDGIPGGGLAHGFPPRHARLAGHVHLDAGEHWSLALPVTGSADLPTVLLHEIGHAVGLEHDTQDTFAVMHERFEVGGDRRTLSVSDIEALRAVYPT